MNSVHSSETRKSERLQATSGIAVTPHGIGQVINLNRDGISFKCFEEHDFPVEWSMAIYDAIGQSLEKLHVKKVWEKWLSNSDSKPFLMEVGGEFQHLSPEQKVQINTYLRQLVRVEE
jgi:hypothetical protein